MSPWQESDGGDSAAPCPLQTGAEVNWFVLAVVAVGGRGEQSGAGAAGLCLPVMMLYD